MSAKALPGRSPVIRPSWGNLREAVTYATNRWAFLSRYAKADFGHIHIDQNPLERCFSRSRPAFAITSSWDTRLQAGALRSFTASSGRAGFWA